LIDQLREELRRFTGAHSLEDDATMLVVRILLTAGGSQRRGGERS
jgi:hypothetical protein